MTFGKKTKHSSKNSALSLQQSNSGENKVEDTFERDTINVENSGKKARKKWTKKKKITVWSIVAGVLIAAILASSLSVKFLMFSDENYDVDLAKIKAGSTIFFDDFDAETLNKNIWLIFQNYDEEDQILPRRGGWWKEEAVSVKDSNLIISTFKSSDQWVTGAVAALGTEGYEDDEGNLGFARTYGYYEARMKMPKGYGIWSAFWFMPTNGRFDRATSRDASVYGAEIDVAEVPIWPDGRVQQAVHVGGYQNFHDSTVNPRWLTVDDHGDIYNEYHTYGLYWDENIYKFYIDDRCVWTTSYNKNVSKVDEYMIFSVEIGGANGVPNDNPWKYIGGKLITENKEGDAFRTEFLIDYVKVWAV